tara:strand:+ start:3161 stop:3487 length:327 start_codon:yes stop_codon:yes gene_type:complete
MKLDYKYKAIAVNIASGNSLTVMVDLGFEVWIKVNVKLFGINTDLPNTKIGEKARDRLQELLKDKEFYLTSMHLSKYGRCLAEIEVANINVNEQLIQEDLATIYLKNE